MTTTPRPPTESLSEHFEALKDNRDTVRITIKKITANLGRGVGTPEFEKNLLLLLEATKGFKYWVIYLQEIDEADTPNEHKIVRDFAKRYDYQCVGMESHVPMLISNSLHVHWSKVYFGAKGLAKFSPNRHWNAARVAPKASDLDDYFMWYEGCTHFPRWTPVLFSRWRTLRKKMGDVMGSRSQRWWFWGMDSNVYGWKKIFPARERTLNKERLDRIQAVKPDTDGYFKITTINEGSINGTIDGHDFPWVVLQFSSPLHKPRPKDDPKPHH